MPGLSQNLWVIVSPHHPACGSALGGSLSLPSRSWVVDVHPQLFDRQKPLILEPLVGHAGLRCQCSCKSPWSFAADTYRDGCVSGRSQLEEVAHLGATPAPLFPVAHAYPSSQPVINFGQWSVIFRYAEVVHPAAGVLSKLLQAVIHGDEPTSTGQTFYSPLELTKGFI